MPAFAGNPESGQGPGSSQTEPAAAPAEDTEPGQERTRGGSDLLLFSQETQTRSGFATPRGEAAPALL